ncbi:Xanthine dehydrogenase C subunit [Trema orientale]|uniref:Xanthine dehydrogenase C subunit n=1 Tax=Trema orientale TaxID=63057 RepID=A0A2P5ENX4_TREOI|nr:Xanthine dehydrogenase C subunit [Trema orientale]
MYSAFTLLFPLILLVSYGMVDSTHIHETFLHCLSQHFSNSTSRFKLIYTPDDTSYFDILNSTIQNPRFSSPLIPKPCIIITPFHASQVQAAVNCSKKHGIEIRIQSGGHDSEGLSYVSDVPFVILDLRNLRSIEIDVDQKIAWVEVGATLGEVYYSIAKKSENLGFPAGVYPTVCVGEHFSGGGYGHLMRKYGLAADNIIDAKLVNVEGRILDRQSMGEDLFWAICGGVAASFGVVLSWKIRLVYIPSKVTVFSLVRILELNETKKLVHKWQYISHKFNEDLLIFVRLQTMYSTKEGNRKIVLQASSISMFLGGVDWLLPLMQKSFPELGLIREDCIEMRWIESLIYANGFTSGEPLEVLHDRTPQSRILSYKEKSDYVKKPIPERALEGMWEMLYEEDVGMALFQLFPYGGKMDEISESKTPFPHRSGCLIQNSAISHILLATPPSSHKTRSWTPSRPRWPVVATSSAPRPIFLGHLPSLLPWRSVILGTMSECLPKHPAVSHPCPSARPST